VSGYLRDFLFPSAGALACTGEHALGRRTATALLLRAAVRPAEQPSGDGRTDQRSGCGYPSSYWKRWSRTMAGTLLLVSHDRAFSSTMWSPARWCSRAAGQVNEICGRLQRLAAPAQGRRPRRRRRPPPRRRPGRPQETARPRPGARRPSYKQQQRELEAVSPGDSTTRGRATSKLQAAIADPALFQGPRRARRGRPCKRLQSLTAEIENAYSRLACTGNLEARGGGGRVDQRRGRPRPSRSLGFGSDPPAASGMTQG